MAIQGLNESLAAHKDVTREFSQTLGNIEREIWRMVDGEIAAAIGMLNGRSTEYCVAEYKTAICEGILVTITQVLKQRVMAGPTDGKIKESEADEMRTFLMREIGSRLELAPGFHVLVQIESCLIVG